MCGQPRSSLDARKSDKLPGRGFPAISPGNLGLLGIQQTFPQPLAELLLAVAGSTPSEAVNTLLDLVRTSAAAITAYTWAVVGAITAALVSP